MKSITHTLISMILGMLLAGAVWFIARAPRGERVVFSSPPTAEPIYVSVVGAVAHPGVYHLD